MYGTSELRLGAISSREKQAGAALLVILLLLISASSFLFVKNLNRGIGFRGEDAMATASALAEAKAALIGRALTDNNRPGSLPCPDTNNDGVPEIFVGSNCPSYAGRFPWRTLQPGDLRDADGERLWYGLTSTLRDNTSAQPINSATPGQLLVDGAIGDVVAVLIAPGTPFAGQNRNAGPNSAINYLEDDNNNGDNKFVTTAAGNFNDRLIFITRQELMAAVEKRVLGEIRQILRAYYQNSDPTPANRFYPYAAALGTRVGVEGLRQGFLPLDTLPVPPPPGPSAHPNPTISVPSWFTNPPGIPTPTNDWEQFVFYAIGTDCIFANKGCNSTNPSDFLTVGTTQNINALVISAGRAITAAPYAVSKGSAQDRTSLPPQPANEYLDSVENTNSDDTYDAVGTQVTSGYNDQMKIIAP
ncbi:MAG: hypothetical protein ACREV4_04745 [Gammaproteobacteria bacterium]